MLDLGLHLATSTPGWSLVNGWEISLSAIELGQLLMSIETQAAWALHEVLLQLAQEAACLSLQTFNALPAFIWREPCSGVALRASCDQSHPQ